MNSLLSLSYITEITEIKIDDKLILEKTLQYIGDVKSIIKIPTIQIIGNICYKSQECIEMFIALKGLETLYSALNTELDNYIIAELCWVASNVAYGPSSYIEKLISSGIIAKLINFIFTSNNFKVISNIL